MNQKNEEQPDKDAVKNKKGWVVPTITTLIGVVVSLVVAWYQINLNEEQALQAEMERSKAVKNELIQIVEEHVINGKPLDVSRLARLSEFRAKEEKLLLAPSVSEVVEGAEFNIIKSQYLEFEKKEHFKEIFNSIYSELSTGSDFTYKGLFENSVNDLYTSFQNGKTSETIVKFNKLLGDFNAKIDGLNAEKVARESRSLEDIVKIVLDKPYIMAMAITIYAFALYSLMYVRRRARQRRKVEREIMEEYAKERAEYLYKKMRDDDQ